MIGKIKYSGYGTVSADYYTVKLGTKTKTIKVTAKVAEAEARDLAKQYPNSTITIVGHKDPKKARAEANKRPWEGGKYIINVDRYNGKPISISLWRRNCGGIVKTVTIHDAGLLFQYDINKRQMDFINKIKKTI